MRLRAILAATLAPSERFERLAGGFDWPRWAAAARCRATDHPALEEIDKAETGGARDVAYARFVITQVCIHDPALCRRFARQCRRATDLDALTAA